MQNTVAKILKIYAVVNAFCGFILGLYVRGDSDNPILLGVCIYFIATCIVASFGIYAFGEVVQLLQDIKRNQKVDHGRQDTCQWIDILRHIYLGNQTCVTCNRVQRHTA